MKKQFHILNGDSLKERFPENIQGEIMVARECFVDGNIQGNGLSELYKVRAHFISNNYDGYDAQDYFEKTVPEFQKMQHIPDHADINLWFEDDLFCQVNFWFVINLLSKAKNEYNYFLVRPKSHSQYGYGGLPDSEIISAYENRLKLSKLDVIGKLWESYQIGDTEELVKLSKQLKNLYPFIQSAVEAHIDRIPTDKDPGRPTESLIKIIEDLHTDEFGPVFKEFCKRESIYGYGDLQVKRLLKEIIQNR